VLKRKRLQLGLGQKKKLALPRKKEIEKRQDYCKKKQIAWPQKKLPQQRPRLKLKGLQTKLLPKQLSQLQPFSSTVEEITTPTTNLFGKETVTLMVEKHGTQRRTAAYRISSTINGTEISPTASM